jgi:hypothetical protein
MLASFMDSYQLFIAALTAPTAFGEPELSSLTGSKDLVIDYTVQAKNDLEVLRLIYC